MAFDGIVTKAISSELQQLSGSRIDKIFQPNKNNIIIGFYFKGSNYALNICTDSQFYRVNLTTHQKSNPQNAFNFCMVLRKHLLGLHIKNFVTSNLERILTIEFEGFDDIDNVISKKLVIELMGKHCNVILLDSNNYIIDSLRHINNQENFRCILPHIKYVLPANNKSNFLDCLDFEDFFSKLPKQTTITDISTIICNTFNGISKAFIIYSLDYLNIKEINKSTLSILYDYITTIISNTDSLNLEFKLISTDDIKDYFLIPSKNTESFSLNYFIDDFYYDKETNQEFINYRNNVLKIILEVLKKYNKRLININEKLKSCDDMDIYRLYGELLTANLYKIPKSNLKGITLENYYDNNNEITIPLDERYNPSINAKKFFKKYNKLKSTLETVSIQKIETINELNYIESIVYELENSSSLEDVLDIIEEISENVVFKSKNKEFRKHKNTKIKKSNMTKNKKVAFNPLKYKIDDYILLVGRNNKENDYLTLKYSKKTDIWFHTKDIHGSHAVLLINEKNLPNNDILIKCAQIVAFHSKAKNSSNVPVDFCEVKYVKKPKGSKPGMVIYTNNQTLNVQPRKI